MAYQAYFKGSNVVADTPKAAAEKFFATYPKGRKCNLIQGTVEGNFFVVKFGRVSEGEWPQSYKDVTKKSLAELPG